jgi:hypothetical protein
VIITYQRFMFTLQAKDLLVLPLYKGSTFRGGFGHAFRRVVCALKGKECKECLLRQRCVYAYIFETHPGLSGSTRAFAVREGGRTQATAESHVLGMDRYEAIPHPFILEPPLDMRRTYQPGESLSFGLVLVGRAADYLPYFVYAFDEMGKSGIGKSRGRYSLLDVTSEGQEVYSVRDRTLRPVVAGEIKLAAPHESHGADVDSVTLQFLTPARIVYARHLTAEITFPVLVTSLLRRLFLVAHFHCGVDKPPWDHREMIEHAQTIEIEAHDLSWWEWERYSARQGVRMKMGGVVGTVTYRGALGTFMQALKAGEILHVGKGTTFGLGKYELREQAISAIT